MSGKVKGRLGDGEEGKEELVGSEVFRFFDKLSLESGEAVSQEEEHEDACRAIREGMIALLKALTTAHDQHGISAHTWHKVAADLLEECKAQLRQSDVEAVQDTHDRLAPPIARKGQQLSHNTAIVICPPQELQNVIQLIRREHDKRHVDIWPPHITLFYPFVQPSSIPEVKRRLQTVLADATPFTLNLNSFGSFDHGKRGCVTWLAPTPSDPVEHLHATLAGALADMAELPKMKTPHMTVARGQPHPLTDELAKDWHPASFQVDRVFLLQRTDTKSPMQVVGEVPFDVSSVPLDRTNSDTDADPVRDLLQTLKTAVRRGVLNRSRMLQLRRLLLPPPAPTTPGERPTREEETLFAAHVLGTDGADFGDDGPITITVTRDDTTTTSPMVVDVEIVFDENHPSAPPHVRIVDAQNVTAAQQTVLSSLLAAYTEHWLQTPTHTGSNEPFFVMGVFKAVAAFLRDEASRTRQLRKQNSGDGSNDRIEGVPMRYKDLLHWRPLNSSNRAQLESVSVRELDNHVYRALLEHLRVATRDDDLNRQLRLVHVENIVHPSLLQRHNAAVKRLLETGALHDRSLARPDAHSDEISTALPLLAFHGACERDVAASIADQGLVAPGDFDHDGRYISMNRGALYGAGSYVSPSILKSHWYTYGDARGHHQMVAGIAIPGRCRHFTSASIEEMLCSGFEIHDLECDSHTDPSKEELILYSSESFLPVLLINYTFRWPDVLEVSEQVNLPSAPALKGSVEGGDTLEKEAPNRFAVAHLLTVPTANTSEPVRQAEKQDKKRKQDKGMGEFKEGKGGAAKHDKKKRQQQQQRARKEVEIAQGSNGEWNKLMASFGPRRRQTLEMQLQQEHWLLELRPSLYRSAYGAEGVHHHVVLCLGRSPLLTPAATAELASACEHLIRQSGAHSVTTVVCDRNRGTLISTRPRCSAADALAFLTSDRFADLMAPGSRTGKGKGIGDALVDETLRAQEAVVADRNNEAFVQAEAWLHRDLLRAAQRCKAAVASETTSAETQRRFALNPIVEALSSSSSLGRKVQLAVTKRVEAARADTDRGRRRGRKKDTRGADTGSAADGTGRTAGDSRGDGDSSGRSDSEFPSLLALLSPPTYQAQLQSRFEQVRAAFQDSIRHTLLTVVPQADKSSNDAVAFSDTDLNNLRCALTRASAKVLLVLVSFGKGHLSPAFVRLKLALQTLSLYEPRQVYEASRSSLLLPAMSDAARFIRRTIGDTVHVSIPFHEEALGWGLVTSLVRPPDVHTTLCVDTRASSLFLLFRGRPQRHLVVNGAQVPLRLTAREPLLKRLRVKRRRGGGEGDKAKGDEAGGMKAATRDRKDGEEDNEIDTCTMLATPALHAQILRALGTYTSQLKAVATQHDDAVRAGLCFVQSLAQELQEEPLDFEGVTSLPLRTRMEMVTERRRFLTQLQQLLNTIRFCCDAALDTKRTLQEACAWLIKASDMKYGARALKKSTIVSVSLKDIVFNLHCRVRGVADIQADQASGPTQDVSLHSHMSWLEHLQQTAKFANELHSRIAPKGKPARRLPLSTSQLLYVSGVTGALISVEGSEAANVNPWQIKVTNVSTDTSDTASAMCALDSSVRLKDSAGRTFNAVLPLSAPEVVSTSHGVIDSKLFRALHAVVMTRNPNLVLPQQRIALIAVALVQALRQTMEPKHRTPALVCRIARLAHDLCVEIEKRGSYAHWHGIVHKLMQPMPGRFLTEAEEDDIASVAKPVAAVAVLLRSLLSEGVISADEHGATSDDRAEDAALAVLAESVSRGVRIHIKQKENRSRKRLGEEERVQRMLQHTLNIDPADHVHALPDDETEPASVEHSAAFDMEKAHLRSGKFFRQRWTNCPPQSVVAAFGFMNILVKALERHRPDVTLEAPVDPKHPMDTEKTVFAWLGRRDDPAAARARAEVADALEGITMKSFAERYTRQGCDHWDLQVALYVQALQHHSSKTRRQGLPTLRNSREIVREAAASVRAFNYKREVMAKMQRLRIAFLRGNAHAKYQLKLQEQELFLETHSGVPKIFTHEEAATLNVSRPPHDQIELTPSGLPRHHCAFVECPHYLVNMSTPRDRALGLRHGLYKHFSKLFDPELSYIKGLHLHAAPLVHTAPDKSVFAALALKRLPVNLSQKRMRLLAQQLLEDMWNQTRGLGATAA